MVEAVMRAQGYAVSMEHDMSRVFGCNRGGMSGIVDSDFIRRNSLAAVLMTCGYIYGLVDDLGKRTIEKFIEETSFYWKMNLDDNGEEAVIDIIDKFSKICDLINN